MQAPKRKTVLTKRRKCVIINIVRKCGGDSKEDPPVPMPNTEVKLLNADDTWRVTARESRKLPQQIWPVGQEVKTRPFHGCNASSILARVTIINKPFAYKRLIAVRAISSVG